ncbi:hypothetical protein ACWGPZ_27000 [Priestia megaterium]
MNIFPYRPVEIIKGEVNYTFKDFNEDLIAFLKLEFGDNYHPKTFDFISTLFISQLNGLVQSDDTHLELVEAFQNEITILQAVFMKTFTEQIEHGVPQSTAIKITNGLYQTARKSI